jgi:hypothetical protein
MFAAGCVNTCREGGMTGAARIEFRGYADCIELTNCETRVVLCPQTGGRLLEYSLNGTNSLYVSDAQDGWTYDPDKEIIDPCGGRFDVGPEMVIPEHPGLWLGEWTGEITGPRSARLISIDDEATGLRLIREFRLDETSSRLTFTQTMENLSNETKKYCYWGRTMAVGGGRCLIPLTPDSKFPRKYVKYDDGYIIRFIPEDTNVVERAGFLEVKGPPSYPKVGVDSCAGWFAYAVPNDLMFVKKFPVYPDRVYNEIAGLTVAIFYFGSIFCELEPIGPMEKIGPGESASFTEESWLIPFECPGEGVEIDLDNVTNAVSGFLTEQS